MNSPDVRFLIPTYGCSVSSFTYSFAHVNSHNDVIPRSVPNTWKQRCYNTIKHHVNNSNQY